MHSVASAFACTAAVCQSVADTSLRFRYCGGIAGGGHPHEQHWPSAGESARHDPAARGDQRLAGGARVQGHTDQRCMVSARCRSEVHDRLQWSVQLGSQSGTTMVPEVEVLMAQ